MGTLQRPEILYHWGSIHQFDKMEKFQKRTEYIVPSPHLSSQCLSEMIAKRLLLKGDYTVIKVMIT